MKLYQSICTVLMASVTIPTLGYAADTATPTAPSVTHRESMLQGDAPEGAQREPVGGTQETRDDAPRGLTAQNQSSDPKAIEITRNIRRRIVERDDFSTSAKNVKIITDDQGAVTLRGPVRSSNERQEIEQIAKALAASGQVNNQIVVAQDEERSEGERHG